VSHRKTSVIPRVNRHRLRRLYVILPCIYLCTGRVVWSSMWIRALFGVIVCMITKYKQRIGLHLTQVWTIARSVVIKMCSKNENWPRIVLLFLRTPDALGGKKVGVRTKCHWRAQLLAHALSQTHLLKLGSYFFSWVFFYYCSIPKSHLYWIGKTAVKSLLWLQKARHVLKKLVLTLLLRVPALTHEYKDWRNEEQNLEVYLCWVHIKQIFWAACLDRE